ncbi:hypothetical protein MHK_003670 [Candidatus Magnetomorum sp. HK-1]|nr:hypothetical protein MHK_003670 [Candidatus Magnetomorum sp. HK-1]
MKFTEAKLEPDVCPFRCATDADYLNRYANAKDLRVII